MVFSVGRWQLSVVSRSILAAAFFGRKTQTASLGWVVWWRSGPARRKTRFLARGAVYLARGGLDSWAQNRGGRAGRGPRGVGRGQMRKTKLISEEVLSVKCQVLSRANGAGNPRRAPTSNFTLHTSGGTPTGRRPTAQNKANSSVPVGRGVGVNGVGCCTNKPNFSHARRRASALEKRIYGGFDMQQGLGRTKPISRRARYRIIPLFHYSSIPIRYPSCKTKPICPAVPGETGPGERETKGDRAKRTQFPATPGTTGPERHGTRVKCAKQSQFLPEQQDEQVLCRKALMVNSTLHRPRQNKANFPMVDCGLATDLRRDDRLCKTNPIPRLRIRKGLRPAAWACAGRLYKQTQLDRGKRAKRSQFRRWRRVGRGQSCKTNPISLVG